MNLENKEDPTAITKNLIRRDSWLRSKGSEIGLDSSKFILGSVLSDIIGDDYNCFYWSNFPLYQDENLYQKAAVHAQDDYTSRLEREVATPELPQTIRDRIKQNLDDVKLRKWIDRRNLIDAKEKWTEVKDWVNQLIKKDSSLKQAIDYSIDFSDKVNSFYQEYLASEVGNPDSNAV